MKAHQAFHPQFTITPKINQALVDIERVRGFLDAIKLKEEWFVDMQKEALILEAHYSTHIEGTALNLRQAKDILEGKKVKGANIDDRKELINYTKTMDFVSKYLGKETPITEGLIQELHKILVKTVRGGKADPGNYRRIQNYVIDSRTNEIIYTPPGPLEVPHLMKEFVEWLNQEKGISPILAAGIAQLQFVHVHPFIDGNGRTARILSTLILYQTGYDFKRLFSISEYYDKNRQAYYRAIQSVRKNNMDMTAWLEYFANGLRVQMLTTRDKGETIIKKESYLEKAKKKNLNERQIKILLYLVEKKRLTVDECTTKFQIIRRTAQRDLALLVEHKLVQEVAKSKTDPTKYYEIR